jgi:hypothetical protein
LIDRRTVEVLAHGPVRVRQAGSLGLRLGDEARGVALVLAAHHVPPVAAVCCVEVRDLVAAVAAERHHLVTPSRRLERLGPWLGIGPRHGGRL